MRSKLNKFLHYLQIEKGFSQGTIEAYRLDIEKGLIPFLRQQRKLEVGEATKDDIRVYLDYVATDRGNCGATRARKLAAIKSFFNYLVANEGLKVNPAASIRSPRIPEKEPEYLTEEECIRLLEAIARKGRPRVRERDMAIAVLFLHTGLRVSELTTLKLINVDLDTIIEATHKEDGIEALAWYKSYHYWLSQQWGIKILEEGVFYTARCLQDGHPSQELSKFDSLDYVQLAFNILQLHEYFHFMADVACTILELAQRKPLFCQYSSTVYPQDRFEEAIANAYASRMMRKAGISEAVKQFMTKQPLPYDQFFQWTTRRAFQYGRQKLMELMCHDLPSSTGSTAGAELLLRIDHADLDYQDAPIYLESSRVARRVSSPLLFVESIRNLESSAKFDGENAQLPHETNKKVANTVDNLSCNLQQPLLHFKKIRGHGAVFMCKVDNTYSISLCHHGEDRWELLRVGRYDDIYSNPW